MKRRADLRPGDDRRVSDVLVNLSSTVEYRPGNVAEELVQQSVVARPIQGLAEDRRGVEIQEHEDPNF